MFTSFSPLSERYSESAGAAYLSGNLSSDWHSKLLLSRVIDDLHQNQPDPYLVASDFDYTTRDTLDWQNDSQHRGDQRNTELRPDPQR